MHLGEWSYWLSNINTGYWKSSNLLKLMAADTLCSLFDTTVRCVFIWGETYGSGNWNTPQTYGKNNTTISSIAGTWRTGIPNLIKYKVV